MNTLGKIKNAEIKDKRLIPGQKELIKLLDNWFDIILTDKTLNQKIKKTKMKIKMKMMRINIKIKMKIKMNTNMMMKQ